MSRPIVESSGSENISEKTPADIAQAARTLRKLSLLKKSGLFGSTEGIVFERARSVNDLHEAYQLVHEIYSGTGFIRRGRAKLRVRMFEATPKMATFVAKAKARIVGVLSVIGDSRELGLPSDISFKAELDSLRESGRHLCEVTNQAVDDEYRRTSVPTDLIRCAMAHGIHAGYDEGVATVSPGHGGFYRMLGFRQIGSERSYSDTIHDPVVALSMDVRAYRQVQADLDVIPEFIQGFMAKDNPFHQYVKGWAADAERQFLVEHLLRKVFVTETRFVDQCSSNELRLLRLFWGRKLFAAVTDRSMRVAIREWITGIVCRLDTFNFRRGMLFSRRL